MEHTTASVNLTISSCSLSLTNISTGHIIAKHDMPRISFASGGDTVISIYYCLLYVLTCDIIRTLRTFNINTYISIILYFSNYILLELNLLM